MATDVIRNLPGDHPVGMTLDDTGQRIFVLADQSHTLMTFDTANGDLVGHTTPYGDPIPTSRRIRSLPALRAGLTLFFRANSSKPYAPDDGSAGYVTTGNNWMSCGGCHLDGFDSTNLRFFESLQPSAPANDAEIGHIGLVDNFSTAPATPSRGVQSARRPLGSPRPGRPRPRPHGRQPRGRGRPRHAGLVPRRGHHGAAHRVRHRA